jgi:hypothetical protein
MKSKTGGWDKSNYQHHQGYTQQQQVDDVASMASGYSGVSAGIGGTSTKYSGSNFERPTQRQNKVVAQNKEVIRQKDLLQKIEAERKQIKL